jgi:hypothetical protein
MQIILAVHPESGSNSLATAYALHKRSEFLNVVRNE